MDDKKSIGGITMRIEIKTFNELIEQYGVYGNNGDAKCECTFTKEMEILMPANRIIFVFRTPSRDYLVWKSPRCWFSISTDMIESILVE